MNIRTWQSVVAFLIALSSSPSVAVSHADLISTGEHPSSAAVGQPLGGIANRKESTGVASRCLIYVPARSVAGQLYPEICITKLPI